MSGKHRNYVFTINNYNEDDVSRIRELGGEVGTGWLVFGYEVGESGTPHIQGYVEFKNPRAFTAVAKRIGGHIEIRKGTAKQATDYCKKDGKFEEFGEMKNPNGVRKDYNVIKALCKEGVSIRSMLDDDIINDNFTLSFCERIMKYYEPIREWECRIIWLWGPTGTGKSKWAYQYCKEDGSWFKANKTDKWWDGYDGQNIVWIDDIRGDWCKFSDMLEYADRFPVQVEVKGGYRQLRAKQFVITCPYKPEGIWKTVEDMGQLYRRIGRMIEFTDRGTVEQGGRVIIEPTTQDLKFDNGDEWACGPE